MKWIFIFTVLCALFGFGMLGHAVFTLLDAKPDTDTSQVMTVVYEDNTLMCYRISSGYTNSIWYNSFQQCLVKR
jgi:hypothetical protein